MKTFKIKRYGILREIVEFTGDKDWNNMSFCSFVWFLLWGSILCGSLIIIAIGCVTVTIIALYTMMKDFFIMAHDFFFLGMTIDYAIKYHPYGWIFMCILIICMVAGAGVLLSDHLTFRRKAEKTETTEEKEVGFIRQLYTSFKTKTCVKVEFK
ncbi:hypothetical protein RsoM2USA_74 [Ralstonia phage RsoM2USA]|nr:hypothetical protein RsoM2USA_74 [Ralstonia phage RsoM2USA]